MSSPVTYSLVLRGSDGITYYCDLSSNLNWIQQKLEICGLKARLNSVEEKNGKLEARLQALEQPIRMQKIVRLLRTQDQGRTERWLENRIPGMYYDDLVQLKQQQQIHSFMKGKTHLYIVKEI